MNRLIGGYNDFTQAFFPHVRGKILSSEEGLRPLGAGIDREVRGDVPSGMTTHAVGDDPKIAAIDGGKDILICAPHMARFCSPNPQPSQRFVHRVTASPANGRSKMPTDGGP
jgi:hypothetical protein